MRRRTFTLVLATLALWAVCVPGQEESAARQTQVVEHWSPYDYPTAFPPGARVYIIVSGDTLWDIAQRNYRNPLLWPQIYSANSYIGNPHWIYPGDPLVLPELAVAEAGRVVEPGVQPVTPAEDAEVQPVTPAEERPGEQPGGRQEIEALEDAPVLEEGAIFETEPRSSYQYQVAATEMDLYCSSVIYPAMPDTGLWIADREFDHQIEMFNGDIVYINAGKGFVEPGDIFLAANDHGPVHHPHTGKFIGIAFQEVGQVKVILASEEYSVAEVITACDGLAVGSVLIPFEDRPNPIAPIRQTMPTLEQYQEIGDGPVGCIVRANYNAQEIGVGEVINVDIGAADGIKVGERLYIFREKPIPLTLQGRRSIVSGAHGTANVQRIIGEAIVYLTLESTSCARVTYTADFPLIGYFVVPVRGN